MSYQTRAPWKYPIHTSQRAPAQNKHMLGLSKSTFLLGLGLALTLVLATVVAAVMGSLAHKRSLGLEQAQKSVFEDITPQRFCVLMCALTDRLPYAKLMQTGHARLRMQLQHFQRSPPLGLQPLRVHLQPTKTLPQAPSHHPSTAQTSPHHAPSIATATFPWET